MQMQIARDYSDEELEYYTKMNDLNLENAPKFQEVQILGYDDFYPTKYWL